MQSKKYSSVTSPKESKPVIKGLGLGLGLKNPRVKNLSISNLSYLCKLIERAACDQLVEFGTRTGNIEQNQSAYRMGHSTQSALFKVKSNLLHAIKDQKITCLLLLDLSAASDTVDHNLLLNQLHFRYEFDGTRLNWVSSYLRSRTKTITTKMWSSSG